MKEGREAGRERDSSPHNLRVWAMGCCYIGEKPWVPRAIPGFS